MSGVSFGMFIAFTIN